MTKVNDPDNLGSDLFGYAMKYNNPENTSLSTGRFNGNIAEINWRTSTAANDNRRRYSFTYDRFNRLQQGIYSEPGSSVVNNNNYNEQLTYDLNGNILTLKRFSKHYSGTTPELIDDLVYNYTGNRLDKITLPSGTVNNASGYNALQNTITYDSNGSMISQLDKNIASIDYNHLNLPRLFTTGSGRFKQTTAYTYRADGVKVGKNTAGRFFVSTNTDYLDGFQYNASLIAAGDDSSNFLQFVPTSEGYFDFQQNKYIYNYTDHLGNVRLSYFNNGNGGTEVLEENNYYPFGLKHGRYNELAGNPAYQYKYNGKELQEKGMYDYGARMYMPDIGRWGVVYPLAETSRRWSPYNYAYNNPMRFIDPDGMQNEDIIIKGNKSQDALQQLQAVTKGQLNLSMDANGKVTATQVEGATLSQGASELLAATTDSSITVNVSATDNDFTSDGAGPLLGYFGGNKSSNPPIYGSMDGSPGQKTVANQETNADALGNLSKANGNPGQAMLHEVTEAYRGALITQSDGNTGVRSTSNNDEASNPNSVYRRAHDGAVNQGGNITENFYNSQGQQIYRGASNFQPVKLIYKTNNNTTPFHTVPKQR